MRVTLPLLIAAALLGGSPAWADDPKPGAPAEKPAERGYLGFKPVPVPLLDPAFVNGYGIIAMSGVVVVDVTKGGPAEAAGMKVADFLVKLNGKEMPSTDVIDPSTPTEGRQKFEAEFQAIAESMKPGAEIEVVLKRKGEVVTIKATAVTEAVMKRIAKGLPAEDVPAKPREALPQDAAAVGFEALPLGQVTEKQREDWKVKAASGVIVSRVVKGSPADLAGLKLGDALIKYGGEELPSGSDLADAGEKAVDLVKDAIAKIEAGLKVGDEVEFSVRRDFKPMKLKAKVIDQASLKKLIEEEAGGAKPKDGDKPKDAAPKDGDKPSDPPKDK